MILILILIRFDFGLILIRFWFDFGLILFDFNWIRLDFDSIWLDCGWISAGFRLDSRLDLALAWFRLSPTSTPRKLDDRFYGR